MTTIIFRDKSLIKTTYTPIYQNENRVDTLHFLIDKNDLSSFNITDMVCMLCVILPNKEIGKLTFLQFEEELYLDKFLVSNIPITKAITSQFGDVILFLIFSYTDKDGLFYYLPTNEIKLNIIKTNSTDSFIDPDEVSDILNQMQQEIQNLKVEKVSNIDIIDNKLYFYSDSNKQKILGVIDLPTGVTWTNMEEV